MRPRLRATARARARSDKGRRSSRPRDLQEALLIQGIPASTSALLFVAKGRARAKGANFLLESAYAGVASRLDSADQSMLRPSLPAACLCDKKEGLRGSVGSILAIGDERAHED